MKIVENVVEMVRNFKKNQSKYSYVVKIIEIALKIGKKLITLLKRLVIFFDESLFIENKNMKNEVKRS